MIEQLDIVGFREKLFDDRLGGDAHFLGNKDTVLELFASWCPHCQAMQPRLEAVSIKNANIEFYQIDIDKIPEVGDFFGISGFPTFLFIPRKGKILLSEGERSAEELDAQIRQAFRSEEK